MILVFISKRQEEFERYKSCPVDTNDKNLPDGNGLVYYINQKACTVVVLNGECLKEEKENLVKSIFGEEDVKTFVKSFSDLLGKYIDYKSFSEGYVFVHWGNGPGTVMDIEKFASTSFENNDTWSNNNNFKNWSLFALSSRRPDLLDVNRNPIQLPTNMADVYALIEKAEGESLSEFWLRYINDLPSGDNSAIRKKAIKQMEKVQNKILESSLSYKHKKRYLEEVSKVIDCLKESTQCNKQVKLFISSFLTEEHRYV